MVGILRPPPMALWCWVVVLPGSVGLFASVLLVGVLCTPPPPLWPCGGSAVLAYMHTYIRTATSMQCIASSSKPRFQDHTIRGGVATRDTGPYIALDTSFYIYTMGYIGEILYIYLFLYIRWVVPCAILDATSIMCYKVCKHTMPYTICSLL